MTSEGPQISLRLLLLLVALAAVLMRFWQTTRDVNEFWFNFSLLLFGLILIGTVLRPFVGKPPRAK